MTLLRAVATLLLWMVIFPVLTGILPAKLLLKKRWSVLGSGLCGFFLMLGLFQINAVWCIRKIRTLGFLIRLQSAELILISLAGIAVLVLEIGKKHTFQKNKEEAAKPRRERKREEYVLWGLFFGLLLLQFLMSVLVMTSDGDDAYYIGQALVAVDTDRMYLYDAYTGVFTSHLDYRHILAPFPMWIALLSKVSGVHVAIIAHTILPVFLISVAYTIWGFTGERFFARKPERLPLFMILLLLIISFSNYSVYTAETFLLTRTWQGKAILAGQVIPMAFYLFVLLAERTEPVTEPAEDGKETERSVAGIFVMLFLVNLCGTLASTMGVLVLALMEMVFGILIAVRNRRGMLPVYTMLTMIPCAYYGLLYMLNKGLVIAMQNAYQ